MRDLSPGPALIRYTVRVSTARIPRKSSDSAPGTLAACHVTPPSTVRRYVPPVPLAQTTRSSTALTPRSDAAVLAVCGIHACAHSPAANANATPVDARGSFIALYGRSQRLKGA